MTKKIGRRWLPAVLEVTRRFESHADAAEWYLELGLPVPSNCIVAGNPPIPYEMTSQDQPMEKWDAGHKWRARQLPVFLSTAPLFLDLWNPPLVPDAALVVTFGRVPITQNPPRISEGELTDLLERIGIGLSAPSRKADAAPV
jgi:hypothetical protein